MKLEEHIHILKTLRVPFKANLMRIMYHIVSEHKKEIKDIDEFIDQIMPKREPRSERKAVMSVGELIRDAEAKGVVVRGKERRGYRRRRPSSFSEGESRS